MKWAHPKLFTPLLLVLLDLITLYVSVRGAYFIRYGYWGATFELAMLSMACLLVFIVYVFNMYRVENVSSTSLIFFNMALASLFAGILLSSIVYFGKFDINISAVWRANLVLSLIMFWVVASSYRFLLKFVLGRWQRKRVWLAIGLSDSVPQLQEALSTFPDSPSVELVSEPLNRYEEFIGYEGVILGKSLEIESNTNEKTLMEARFKGLQMLSLTDFYERYLLRLPVGHLKSSWLLVSGGFGIAHHDLSLKLKRLIDLFVAVMGLIILWPLMLLIYFVLRVNGGGPALYSQIRVGAKGRTFTIYKFRSMYHGSEICGVRWAEQNDKRITPLGRILRATRLDELPQLWNVVKGDMSFIGPRPERPEFVAKLRKEIPFYELRHLVKPGLTGWAQVMYPYGASVEDAWRKLEYDLYYIKNYSVVMDISILFRTLRVILHAKGR